MRFSELSDNAQNKAVVEYFFDYNMGLAPEDRINIREAYECCLDTNDECEYNADGSLSLSDKLI